MLRGKKVIVLGDRDGIPGPAIAKCLKAAGAMDPENQSNIKKMVDQYGAENLVIVLGAADMESAEITAETAISGDPSFSGPLAGVSLGLPVYHILEPEVMENIPEEMFREQLAMMEMVIDGDAISEKFREIRKSNNDRT
jgi:anthranilate phosphoribosyltransferase